MTQDISQIASNRTPKLLDQLRRYVREKHYSQRTERAYVYWAIWYIRFHRLRHPKDMGGEEIRAFMSYLINERHVAGATYTQALSALLFLYRTVLEVELPWIDGNSRPKRAPKQPVVLTPDEVQRIFNTWMGPFSCLLSCCTGPACACLNVRN